MEDLYSKGLKMNLQYCKIFGIWPGVTPNKYYKYYSFLCLFSFLIVYNALLTVNLFYTPIQVNFIIEELMFYFNEVSIMTKVGTILFWRKEILTVCDLLDSNIFKGNDDVARDIITRDARTYKICWNLNTFLCHICFLFGPLLSGLLQMLSVNKENILPISKYHFLSAETKERYFGYLYAYQCVGVYIQMTYNINIDSFLAGLLFYAITQTEVLNHELRSLQWEKQSAENVQERLQIDELNYCLRHYESILKYCAIVQDIFSLHLFVQIGSSSITICSVLCAFLQPERKYIYMLTYLIEMTLVIFVPTWLGARLTSQSEQLVFAAYDSEWVSRCRRYKSSLKLFIQRANTPIVITGMKLFALNLGTFVTIMKTAYSFVTLVRSFQERN